MSGKDVTFLLVTYNQESFVRLAVRSALTQDYRGMDIVISDDCSDDGTYTILSEEVAAHHGSNTVTLRRNDTNIGAIEHVNRLMSEIDSELIILACGDDISARNRASRVVEAWQSSGALALSSNERKIDPDGNELGTLFSPGHHPDLSLEAFTRLGGNACCHGASLAWHRSVFDRFGPINPRQSPFCGDHVIPFRALLIGENAYIDEVLVSHRVHTDSDTFKLIDGSGPTFLVESYAAHNTSQAVFLLESLNAYVATVGETPELARYRSNLASLILRSTSRWVDLRQDLADSGFINAWTAA